MGPQLTAADWNTILAWENADSYLWASPPPPPPIVNAVIPVVASGDFNGNGKSDFVWSNSSGVMSMWECDATAQQVTTTSLGPMSGWAVLGSAHFSNANGSSASQMLMDYVPTGTMTLGWVTNGALNGLDLGHCWPNIGFISAGQFTNLGGANITNFLVTNVVDHHLYDWWISPQNQLTGFDITATSGVPWANVSLVTAGQFTANGGTNLLVSNNVDYHLYDWWIDSNNTLQGIDLGPYWANVSIVAAGQFTANGGTNFLVSNNVDHHLYDWWIGSNTLQGIDLGLHWAGVQLVAVGNFDNNTTNTQFLVQNTADNHLYEWWIANNTLTGLDLGAVWANVQLIGNSHYNNNSAFNELLVRNTVDGHFYEWWIASDHLSGGDLGAVPGGIAGGMAAGDPGALSPEPATTNAAISFTGSTSLAKPTMASSGMGASLPTTSEDSTSLLVQSMASFGASAALVDSTGALPPTDSSQQPTLATTVEQHLAHA